MPKFEDLTGQKFGRLTVVERAEDRITSKRRHIRWDCTCDCGTKHVIVTTSSLKSGNSKSCGCLQKEKTHDIFFKDISGQKFGRLTVIERVENQGKKVMWRCICECGNYCIVDG